MELGVGFRVMDLGDVQFDVEAQVFGLGTEGGASIGN